VFLIPATLLGQSTDPYNQAPGAETFFSTFSIVAYDPATQELGVGVQSRAFRTGAAVSYARGGVGAVATQAATNQSYGPRGLALLEMGLSPAEVVKHLTEVDEGRDSRQLAVIDAKGRVATYTGRPITQRPGVYAGSIEGKNFSVQGNTLASEEVVKAMARAYETSKGETMAHRLLDALDAGQAAGGDIRGMQSGGLLVVRPNPNPTTATDRVFDLRVDDAPDPFKELRRLLNIQMAGRQTQRSTQLAMEGKFSEAIDAQKQALTLNPGHDQLIYTLAQRYAQAGETRNAIASLGEAISKNKRWKQQAADAAEFAKIKELPEFKRLLQ